MGTWRGNLQGRGDTVVRAAFIERNRQFYMFAGLAPPEAFDDVDAVFTASLRSFRAMASGRPKTSVPIASISTRSAGATRGSRSPSTFARES